MRGALALWWIFVIAYLLTACQPTPPEQAIPTLAVLPTQPPTPQPLTVWQPASGELSAAAPVQLWQFSANAGEAITLEASGTALQLALYDPLGNPLGEGVPLQALLQASGVYTVQVTLLGELGGAYDIGLSYTGQINPFLPTATPRPVMVGFPTASPAPSVAAALTLTSLQPAFGAFNLPDERHSYSFQGVEATYIRVTMTRTDGLLDPYLLLNAPDGRLIAVDDNSGGGRTAQLNGVLLPQTGVYTLTASGEGLTGTYELRLEVDFAPFESTPRAAVTEAATATAEPIQLTPPIPTAIYSQFLFDHAPVRGEIDRAGDIGRYRVPITQAVSGGREPITVGVVPAPGFIPQLELYNSAGGLVQAVNTLGFDGELLLTIDPDATDENTLKNDPFTLFVTGVEGSIGGYTVSYGRGGTRDEVRRGEIFPDRPYPAIQSRRAVRDVWYVRLNRGDVVTLAAVSSDGRFDPILEVVRPDGTLLIRDDNSGGGLDANIRSVQILQAGVHAVRILGADPLVTGAYSLIWRYVESAPTPTPVPRITTLFEVDDMLTPATTRDYPALLQAGDTLQIALNAGVASLLDPVVELVAPDGTVIGRDDDSGGNLNARLVASVPQTGLYQVRVGGYLNGGGFVLSVVKVAPP